MVTFTIDSSVEILDSYLDERFLLWRALRASICASGFHTCFGPRRALQASIQVLGKFRTLTASVFALGLWRVLWASLRASAGTMSTGCWGRAVSRAGPGTSRGRARRRSCQHATASAGERISSTGLLRGYILQRFCRSTIKSLLNLSKWPLLLIGSAHQHDWTRLGSESLASRLQRVTVIRPRSCRRRPDVIYLVRRGTLTKSVRLCLRRRSR